MAFLEVKNLKKSFGKTEVLKGIDFSLEKGEVLAMIGASGGGKTTLLRCLNFLELADAGTISIDGQQIYTEIHPGMRCQGYRIRTQGFRREDQRAYLLQRIFTYG